MSGATYLVALGVNILRGGELFALCQKLSCNKVFSVIFGERLCKMVCCEVRIYYKNGKVFMAATLVSNVPCITKCIISYCTLSFVSDEICDHFLL